MVTPNEPVSPLLSLLLPANLVKQGAEAKVYRSTLLNTPILLKHRFPKQYRHPTLDRQLTRTRVTSEARCLVRAKRAGVCVPGVRCVDETAGVVGMEWIEGWSVREVLGGGEEGDEVGGVDEDNEVVEEGEGEEEKPEAWVGRDLSDIPRLMGNQLALLHLADLIHGDLTTSNILLRPLTPTTHEIVMIDFGLSYTSILPEDKAVDLYVLERAFASTHPDSTGFFAEILDAYRIRLGKAQWKEVGRKLEDVRLRGRKRSMLG